MRALSYKCAIECEKKCKKPLWEKAIDLITPGSTISEYTCYTGCLRDCPK